MMFRTVYRIFLLVVFASHAPFVFAEQAPRRIGLIASLSGFAAQYGNAVKEGMELAVAELGRRGERIELIVEDDQSDSAKVLSAYRYLKDVKKIELLIGGSWWVRPLSFVTEKDGIPFISCETMEDRDFKPAATYFVLRGRVADWVRVYEPFFLAHGMRRGAAVTFTSGFSQTISDEMRRLFSGHGREFVGDFQYQDIQFLEARIIALRLKLAHADVVYVDAQPEGLANFLKRREELRMQDLPVIGHSALESAVTQKLVKPELMRNVYFLRRKPPNPEFSQRFEAMFGHEPILSSDLGYYATMMGVVALKSGDPLATLRRGVDIQGVQCVFDSRQVADGIAQEIFTIGENGEAIRVDTAKVGS